MDLAGICAGTLSKNLSLGYVKKDHHFHVENVQNGSATWDDWVGKLNVGYAYSGLNNLTVGMVTDVNTDDVSDSLHNLFVSGMHKDIKYKAKINTNMDTSVFGQVKLNNEMSLQSTISTNLGNHEKVENGFLGNSFNLGITLKYFE